MTKLLDEELEEDEQFWNQDALKEEDHDDNYEEEGEGADEFDSDFDEDEPEPEEEVEKDGDDRVRTKKRLIYPGKPVSTKKKKKKVDSKLEKSAKEDETSGQKTPDEHQDVPDDLEEERIVRKSTRTSVIVRQAERDAIRAAHQATIKPIKRKKEGEEKKMTQEEMLLEAAQTEIINLRNLERVLAREEEVKKKAIVHKAVYSGPQIRYSSKDGYSYIEFSKGVSFQTEINTLSPPYPEKTLCAITGLPAKYRDPKTGIPYATKEAFKILRQRFSDERSRVGEKNDKGNLFDIISGQGFSSMGKRSSVLSKKNKASDGRYLARFSMVPALEDTSSD